jgi:hypothetical protein
MKSRLFVFVLLSCIFCAPMTITSPISLLQSAGGLISLQVANIFAPFISKSYLFCDEQGTVQVKVRGGGEASLYFNSRVGIPSQCEVNAR